MKMKKVIAVVALSSFALSGAANAREWEQWGSDISNGVWGYNSDGVRTGDMLTATYDKNGNRNIYMHDGIDIGNCPVWLRDGKTSTEVIMVNEQPVSFKKDCTYVKESDMHLITFYPRTIKGISFLFDSMIKGKNIIFKKTDEHAKNIDFSTMGFRKHWESLNGDAL